jgi:tetratricopeptide (TPR) repeat protein
LSVLVLVIPLVVGGLVALAILGRAYHAWATRPDLHLAQAERHWARGQWEAAEKRYERARKLLERPGRSSPEDRALLARALLALGELRAGRDEPGAARLFGKARALGARLPREAIVLVARQHALKNATKLEAVQAYLSYLEAVPQPGPDRPRIVEALRRAAFVNEKSAANQRQALIALNQKVAAIAPDLDWPHLHLGLALYLEGRYEPAAEELMGAARLNPRLVECHYWMALCRLRQSVPNVIAAASSMDRYLAEAQDPASAPRRAHGAFEVGSRLIDMVPQRAIAYLERAVAEDGQSVDHVYALGRAYLQTGAMPQAAQALARALEIQPDHVDAHGALAEVSLDSRDLPAAEQHLRIYLQGRPADTRRRCLLVRLLSDQGRHAEIVEQVEAEPALALDAPGAQDVAYVIGRSYAARGGFRRACDWYGVLPAKGAEIRYYEGCAFAHLRRWNDALRCLESAAEAGGEYGPRALVQRGHVALALDQTATAEEAYRQALEGDPASADALYGLGLLAYRSGDREAAAAHLRRAHQAKPGDGLIGLALGAAAEQAGDLAEACDRYGAVREHPEHGPAASVRLGIVSCRSGHYDRAIELLSDRAQEEPNDDAVAFYLGRALLGAGSPERAIPHWRGLAERHPEDTAAADNLARAHYQLCAKLAAAGRDREAVEALDVYLTRHPEDDAARREMAGLRFRLFATAAIESREPWNGAQRELEQAVTCDPENAAYRLYQALAQFHAGEMDAAERAIESLLRASPESRRLQYHLGLCRLARGSADGRDLLAKLAGGPDDDYARFAHHALCNDLARQGHYEDVVCLGARPPQGTAP